MEDQTSNTILVVDDTPTNLNVLLPTLEAAGFDVLIATDGKQALQRAELGLPELILLDIVMPGIDGFETCRQLKLNPKLSGIPVIFMTALHDTKEKLAAFAAGGVDYITKPFASEEVLERVKTHLTLRRLQRTLQEQNHQLAMTSAQLGSITEALTRFLQTGSLTEASGLLLDNALRRVDSDCGFIGMLVESANGHPRANILAAKGAPGRTSPLYAPVQAMTKAIAESGFSSLSLAELDSLIGAVIIDTTDNLSRGSSGGFLVTHHECLSLPIIQGNDVVGWCSVMTPGGDVSGDTLAAIERLINGAGVLYAYERLRRREAESQRQRQQAEDTVSYLQEEIKTQQHVGRIIGQSEGMRRVLATVERIAQKDSTVLILGETGTGKEIIARAIHDLSPRHVRPLVKVDCAAIPENLVENELFGHEKGAFTGAMSQHKGRIELADGGTLFLDEIGDMPLHAQSRLLRVLQDHEIERVGGSFAIRVDLRVLAATHRDLQQLVAEGRFREDLYYRLNVIPIELPPLRERRDDIIPLAHFFVSRFNSRHGAQIDGISDASLERLCAYHWPGNVRELENIIERAVILSSGPLLDLSQSMLPAETERAEKPAAPAVPSSSVGLHSVTDFSGTADEAQRQYMLQVLERTRWVIEGPHGAAAQLGLNPSTLRNRMHKLGIHKLARPTARSQGAAQVPRYELVPKE